jgi:hypothetical protein
VQLKQLVKSYTVVREEPETEQNQPESQQPHVLAPSTTTEKDVNVSTVIP